MSLSLSEEVRALLSLQLTPGLGPMRTKALLERFGSAVAALRASAAALAEIPGLGGKLASAIAQTLREVDVEAELKLLEQHRIGLLVRGSPEYPAALTEIHDPPHLLYIRGTLEERDGRAVALVGSRS